MMPMSNLVGFVWRINWWETLRLILPLTLARRHQSEVLIDARRRLLKAA